MQVDREGGRKETSAKQEAEYITDGLRSLKFCALSITFCMLLKRKMPG